MIPSYRFNARKHYILYRIPDPIVGAQYTYFFYSTSNDVLMELFIYDQMTSLIKVGI
jgi:hypothetical protein